MIARGGGKIINICPMMTELGRDSVSAYAAAKGAVEVFTKYLAKELSARKITANTVEPGAVGTDFGGGENLHNQQKRAAVSNFTALGRVGEPDDIGGVVAFLCTEDSKWINGQRIEVSGGIML